MSVLREKFKSDFKLRVTGGKGWWIAPVKTELRCTKCGNEDGSSYLLYLMNIVLFHLLDV